jgi:hypothetical protein
MQMSKVIRSKHVALLSMVVGVMLVALPGSDAQSPSKTKLGPNPIKCPAKLTCKVPSRGVDYPVCHEGDKPPTCDEQADCTRKGLGNKTCTHVAPFFSLCVQACKP